MITKTTAGVLINMALPSTCCFCLFGRRFDNFTTYCELEPYNERVTDTSPRPDWCPLKEYKGKENA